MRYSILRRKNINILYTQKNEVTSPPASKLLPSHDVFGKQLFFKAVKQMYRFHKRQLKSQRVHKHLNFNKDKNNPHSNEYHNGTGTRFRSYHDECTRQYENYVSLCVEKGFDKRDLWETPLPEHLYESPVHDRTRWKSSVVKTKERNHDRVIKQREHVALS